ncbi:hypothetical protein D3C76_1632010 [compost metagenome]
MLQHHQAFTPAGATTDAEQFTQAQERQRFATQIDQVMAAFLRRQINAFDHLLQRQDEMLVAHHHLLAALQGDS